MSILAILAVGGILTGVEIDKIRIGGPLADAQQQVSDLQADILPPPAYIIEPYLEATLLVRHPETLSTRRAKLAALEASFRSSIARWRASSVDKEVKSLLVNRAARQADRFWTELDGVMLPALRRGDQAAVDASYARLTDAYVAHRRDIDTLVRSVSAAQVRVNEASLSSLHMTIAILALLGLAIAAMLIGGLVYLMRRVLGPVGATADAMHRMADGDLALKLDGGERADEIGIMVSAVEVFRVAAQAQRVNVDKQESVVRELAGALDQLGEGNVTHRIGDALPAEYRGLAVSFDATMERLGNTLSRVAESAGNVRTGASEVRSASDDLSQRTEQQAASLEETAAAMDEITSGVRQTAGSAVRVDTVVAAAHRETQESGDVVRRAVDAMGAIERSSAEISNIIGVIDGIAFQTNLLALNAGVEAARAGDAGKGFAVVASEVRALAQRSADAAKEVKDRIQASSAQVGVGVGLVSEAGRALEVISARIGEIAALVAEIAASAQRQATGLQQVNVAVADMDGSTQQNAAMVEEASAAARHLAAEADTLAREVAQFRLSRTGDASAPRPPVLTSRQRLSLAS
ncbi:HAMP domain-containing methyl-accepting chemotaxis protein [Sphingomonas sp. CFBP8993]|nr:HAMP domain-containing methyl-accepting chemotaxis protein [Sphingomonas sp. CFBP8993]